LRGPSSASSSYVDGLRLSGSGPRAGLAGGLSLKVSMPEEAKLWVRLHEVQGRARACDFIIQEYMPGRDLAFDSLWFGGLVTSALSLARYAEYR